MFAQEFSFGAADSRKRGGGAGAALDSFDNWDDDFDLGLSASKKSSTMKAAHGGAAGGGLSKPMPAIKQPPSIGFGSDFKKKQQQDDDFFG